GCRFRRSRSCIDAGICRADRMRASALRGLTSCLARGAGPPLIPRGPRSPPSPRKGEGWGGDRDPLPTANRNRLLPISVTQTLGQVGNIRRCLVDLLLSGRGIAYALRRGIAMGSDL